MQPKKLNGSPLLQHSPKKQMDLSSRVLVPLHLIVSHFCDVVPNHTHTLLCLLYQDLQVTIIAEGACGYGDLHRSSYGKYSAGLSSMLFNRGSTCGSCFEVRCVDHILWCLQGSPSVTLTATDFCPPNYGLPADYGGWCNFPRAHFEMSEAAFAEIAEKRADIVPVQYRR